MSLKFDNIHVYLMIMTCMRTPDVNCCYYIFSSTNTRQMKPDTGRSSRHHRHHPRRSAPHRHPQAAGLAKPSAVRPPQRNPHRSAPHRHPDRSSRPRTAAAHTCPRA